MNTKKEAQNIINQSLTPKLLPYNHIEMLKSLASSPNSKIIVFEGDKMPQIITGGIEK